MKLLISMVVILHALTCAAGEARILTWNTYMIPRPFKFSRQLERQKVIAQELQKVDHDVIVLQEAFMDNFKRRVQRALKHTHPYVYWPKKVRGFLKIFDSGVMVLSKTPLMEIDKTYYTTCKSFDCFASKGAILLETQLAGQSVQLIVTHLQSGQDATGAQIRAKQVKQIQQLMERNQRSDVPQILGGDLNINAYNTSEYERAITTLEMVAPPVAGKLWSSKANLTSCFGKRPKNEIRRIDHVWLKDPEKLFKSARQQITPIRGIINGQLCDLSDHLPVSMDVQLQD